MLVDNIDNNGNCVELVCTNGKSVYNKGINGIKIDILGKNNYIKIYEGKKFENCRFQIGNYNKIIIGKSKYKIQNMRMYSNNYTIMKIGNDFSCLECDIRLQENKTGLIIGDNCMFSTEIRIYASDGHAIYSIESGDVLNIGNIIEIGNHVWVGRRVNLLKNTKISDNCVVGFGSVVTKEFNETNVVIAGFPAKIIKRGINWSRLPAEEYERLHGMNMNN